MRFPLSNKCGKEYHFLKAHYLLEKNFIADVIRTRCLTDIRWSFIAIYWKPSKMYQSEI